MPGRARAPIERAPIGWAQCERERGHLECERGYFERECGYFERERSRFQLHRSGQR
ncbi:MAG: hypothetical protein U0271_26825 [Polyangiaceae bacterium]